MDYQYLNNESQSPIDNLDYWSLVKMLMTTITAETRKKILDKITEMNNQLLLSESLKQSDLARSAVLQSRKKTVTENQHPSFDCINYKGPNPLPLNTPTNANYQPIFNQASPILSNNDIYKNTKDSGVTIDIDLDDIIDELDFGKKNKKPEYDGLDEKLANLGKLYNKIITDKRKRRKEKRQN